MRGTPWYRYYTKYRSYLSSNLHKVTAKEEVKAYLEILLSLTTVIIFSVFALKPTLITIAKLYKDITYEQMVIEKMDKKIANLKTSQDLLNKEAQNISYLQQAIPEEAKPEVVIRQIEGITQEGLISLNYLNTGSTPLIGPAVETTTIPLNLSLAHDFPKIITFVKSLESLRRQITIQGITITKETLFQEGEKDITGVITAYTQFVPVNPN